MLIPFVFCVGRVRRIGIIYFLHVVSRGGSGGMLCRRLVGRFGFWNGEILFCGYGRGVGVIHSSLS